MKLTKYSVVVGCVSALLIGVAWLRNASRVELPATVELRPGDRPPPSVVIKSGPTEPISPDIDVEPQWGRAERPLDPEHWPPSRADWSYEPSFWTLRNVAEFEQIPDRVRAELERLDCRVPIFRATTVEQAIVAGEFERAGQLDLAVLCVHSDQTSATYVFWGGDASRREAMPGGGSSIGAMSRVDIEARLDSTRPLDPDMPTSVDHDALVIGCCECCSTYFYRYNHQWFTLPGAD